MMKVLKINPFPIIISIWIFNMLWSMIYLLIFKLWDLPMISIFYMIFFLKKWWKEFFNESSLKGFYIKNFKLILKISFLIFILSEIMLFISMFWMFMHSSISPNIEIGSIWPPKNLNKVINPFSLPFVGSMILLSSGFTITLSHHFIMINNLKNSLMNIKRTVILGLSFLMIQLIEFKWPKIMIKMSMMDSIYANSFFFITSLHGSHVLGGTLYMNHTKKFFFWNSKKNFSNFEMMSWYWHFVDIVWIFVFSMLYWWNI